MTTISDWVLGSGGFFNLNKRGNKLLLADCQGVYDGDDDVDPDGILTIHPDDASMVIIRALWARLRH